MAWLIELTHAAERQLYALGNAERRQILKFLQKLQSRDDPQTLGKPLSGPLRGLWRYRVGEYRLICEIRRSVLTLTVIRIGNRSDVYRS
ncbi:MAG TPA: type II toxin-antitoxin system RelE/ParE family toxin [Beijerinckiaceae bacterium]|nr:type II toxin-antitoxin system RelE/ParE family toxin [Beijerinckiaceae bacterium]